MLILQGPHKGQTVTLHQFCNDWVTYDTADGATGAASVLRIQLDAAEMSRILDAYRMDTSAGGRRQLGMMLDEFDLQENGTFTRRTQAGRRRLPRSDSTAPSGPVSTQTAATEGERGDI